MAAWHWTAAWGWPSLQEQDPPHRSPPRWPRSTPRFVAVAARRARTRSAGNGRAWCGRWVSPPNIGRRCPGPGRGRRLPPRGLVPAVTALAAARRRLEQGPMPRSRRRCPATPPGSCEPRPRVPRCGAAMGPKSSESPPDVSRRQLVSTPDECPGTEVPCRAPPPRTGKAARAPRQRPTLFRVTPIPWVPVPCATGHSCRSAGVCHRVHPSRSPHDG